MGYGDGAFGRSWRWGPHDGVSGSVRTRESSLPLHPLSLWRSTGEKAMVRSWEGDLQTRKSLTRNWTLPDLDHLLASGKINWCCLSHPFYSILLWQPEQSRSIHILLGANARATLPRTLSLQKRAWLSFGLASGYNSLDTVVSVTNLSLVQIISKHLSCGLHLLAWDWH